MKLREFYNSKSYEMEPDVSSLRNIAVAKVSRGIGRCLEIGPGLGEVASLISQQYSQYYMVEISQNLVNKLKDKFQHCSQVGIMHKNIEDNNLPFFSEAFDTVVMNSVIEHLVDPISTLKYCYHLLKPGGKIVIYTPNVAKWTRRIKLLFGQFPSTASSSEGLIDYKGYPINFHDNGHLHYFTYKSMLVLMERENFRRVSIIPHGNFLSRKLPYLFSEVLLTGEK